MRSPQRAAPPPLPHAPQRLGRSSGEHDVEACNSRTGRCYDLTADIESGEVTRIFFPNGGHLDLDGAELDEDCYAEGESFTASEGFNGDTWEITSYDCDDAAGYGDY